MELRAHTKFWFETVQMLHLALR